MYEIVNEGTGLRFCKFNSLSGVGRNPNYEREIFRHLYQSQRIDYYICPNCIYMVICDKYDVLFKDICELKTHSKKIYLTMVDGKRIEVEKQNFAILCSLTQCRDCEEWVKEYNPPTKSET